MEVTLREGRYCSVWNGKWYKHKDIKAKEVAIKQLKRDWMSSHQLQFIEMSKRMMILMSSGSACPASPSRQSW